MAMYRVMMEAVEHCEWEAYVEADSIDEAKEKVMNRDFYVGDDDLIEQRWNPCTEPCEETFTLQGIQIELDES